MRVGGELGGTKTWRTSSLAVDHVGDAAGDEAERFGDAERLAVRVGIARQEEWQAIAAGEAFVLLARIAA